MKVEDIRKILVVGAGTMGHGIAQVFATQGYEVALFSRTQQTLDRAKVLIESSLATFVQEGMIEKSRVPEIVGRIKMTQALEEGAQNADVAFETVTENKEAKIDIFKKLDATCPPRTLLASNTTALNVFDFVQTGRPDKVLIGHWYTPPQLIPLVDVVKGPQTSEESVQLMIGLMKKVGKSPLRLNKFISGYIVSRFQISNLREVFYLIDNDIITPEELDIAAKAGWALRMLVLGLIQRMDYGGLDLSVKNLDSPYVQSQLAPHDYKAKKIYDLVENGDLGVKTGKGFYEYKDKTEAEYYAERDLKLLKVLKVYNEINK